MAASLGIKSQVVAFFCCDLYKATRCSDIPGNNEMDDDLPELGELEREVMQLVWAHVPITAESVRERLGRPLKESTVRTVLRRLEEKGFVTHDVEGRTFIFRPVLDRQRVAANAVRRIAKWFCDGSIEDVLVGIVDTKMLSNKQLEMLSKKIGQAKDQKK